jgi:hypothetical protein
MVGTFGHGANVKVHYLQGVVSFKSMDFIKQVGDIPGSEKWKISAMFQRQVNMKRIHNDIAPYLQDDGVVKFFAPLTLVLLPRVEEPMVEFIGIQTEQNQGEGDFRVIENKKNFKLLWRADEAMVDSGYGEVMWNETNCHIVAIDGQHRLAALQHVADLPGREGKGAAEDWMVPVVVLAPVLEKETDAPVSLLQIMRNLFLIINKEAKKPTRTREILLSDSSINALATQELLQISHDNDQKEVAERESCYLSLTCLSWQEAKENGERKEGDLFDALEMHEWLEHYILGSDFKDKMETTLKIDPISDSAITTDVWEACKRVQGVPYAHIDKVRNYLRTGVSRGLALFLGAIRPYSKWNEFMRAKEKLDSSKSGYLQKAWHRLRYGDDTKSHNLEQTEIVRTHNSLCAELGSDMRDYQCGKSPLSKDVGKRAIAYAFGELIDCCPGEVGVTGEPGGWDKYAEWSAEVLSIAAEGWFGENDDELDRLYLHILMDPAGNVVKYKLTDIDDGFGALVAWVATNIAQGSHKGVSGYKDDEKEDAKRCKQLKTKGVKYLSKIGVTLRKGYAKQIRADLKRKNLNWDKPKTDEHVKTHAASQAHQHISSIKKRFADWDKNRLGKK